ncbi:MAG: CocE/NonD family hydrolase [Ectothiorhodospiraceae bacterium]|nr:CocE/NonD family hydrolase [Chromatiales bacterium]MCP5154058.1 CocE/NonD family hydrolase [Ectothiorhodospiraceae bacterium]
MALERVDGARAGRAMVTMRDGTRLNTFVYLPIEGGPGFPVILQRTPYGITAAGCDDPYDFRRGWLPSASDPMRGSILRGWRALVARGYAAVYQDTRGRHGSEGEDQVYGSDVDDGHDTLEWIARQRWSDQRVGVCGSSAGATTALAAASTRHPSVRALFAQAGASSIYDDVVYEGQSIELERLWLWVARNIPGLSASHRATAAARAGLTVPELEATAAAAEARYQALDAARASCPPFRDCADWMRLPLLDQPVFATWQPYLDEILSHPLPDAFRARHDFRRDIAVPGFHVTTWYDIFQTSVIAAFRELQARVGNQRLWVGPNDHYFVYDPSFWPRDPFFEWFDHWLRGSDTPIVHEPPVRYSPRAWTPDRADYRADDWCAAETWPPLGTVTWRQHLCGDGTLSAQPGDAAVRRFRYDPRRPLPTLGGRNMLIAPGALDQRPLESLSGQGLAYLGPPLPTDLVLAGPARTRLHVSSDCPDTDLVVKLVEVHPDGTAALLLDGVTRAMLREPDSGPLPLEPGAVVTLDVELGHIAHTVAAGNRLRVDVGSSNFPRRARNTNSGNLLLAADTDADIRVATNGVHHGARTASWLELTLAPPEPSAPR